MDIIDYSLLAKAMLFYTAFGYDQVETPWLVGRESCHATLPVSEASAAMTVGDRYLVGSAEQGFVESRLPIGKYISVSPCFRAGDISPYHQETFLKAELHRTDDVSDGALHDMVGQAFAFFSEHSGYYPKIISTLEGWDIAINGIEVGSYGRREIPGYVWIYGTGIALPRLSQVSTNVQNGLTKMG